MMTEILPVKASTSYIYEPDMYIDFCEEAGEQPTQEGFVDFILEDAMDDLDDGSPEFELVKDADDPVKNLRAALNFAQQQVLDAVVAELFISEDNGQAENIQEYATDIIAMLQRLFVKEKE